MARPKKNAEGDTSGSKREALPKKAPKTIASTQSLSSFVKSICDIMRRGNCAGAMQYVPELTWILFLRILDEREQREEQESEAVGGTFRPSLSSPFRWRDWGAPPAEDASEPSPGWKRLALKKSAPTRTPSPKPSASCSTNATSGAWSACPAASSTRRVQA